MATFLTTHSNKDEAPVVYVYFVYMIKDIHVLYGVYSDYDHAKKVAEMLSNHSVFPTESYVTPIEVIQPIFETE